MDASENELRDAFRTATARPPGTCPDAETLAALVADDVVSGGETERATVLDHVARCMNCADEVQALFALRDVLDSTTFAPAPVAADDDPAPLRWLTAWARWRSNPAVSIPLTLVVLAAVLGVSYVVWRSTQPTGISDGRERSSTAWAIAPVPADRATLAEAPLRLEWTGSAPADNYRVTLYDAESIPIWESAVVTATFVELPADVRARLPVGSPVYWRVVALSGIDRRESVLHRFTISPATGTAK